VAIHDLERTLQTKGFGQLSLGAPVRLDERSGTDNAPRFPVPDVPWDLDDIG
jgi:hypothetical protein